MAVEVAGFYATGGSLLLLSDAGHMLSDAGSIGLALFAAWIAGRPASAARTYGYYRAEILAALANGAILVGITFWLIFEAYERVAHPEHSPAIDGRLMIAFGSFTFLANVTTALILRRALPHAHAHDHDDHDHERDEGEGAPRADQHDLNLRGALLHVLGDVLGSIGAVAAGIIIVTTGWLAADAVMSAGMGLLILASATGIVLRSVDVLLESAPRHVDVAAFEVALGRVDGILGVHDLHIWTITSGIHAMSCHVRVRAGSDTRVVLRDLKKLIGERFGIEHTTVQLEVESEIAVKK
jgi:cobalt-zinc-cadmium efflux system protein